MKIKMPTVTKKAAAKGHAKAKAQYAEAVRQQVARQTQAAAWDQTVCLIG
jgi:hypothetical protein